MKNIRLFSLLGLLLCTVAQVQAQANLSIQGTIQKASGANLDDGEYAMTFRLYDTEVGGTAVWTETQDAVEVLGGVYSTLLGKTNPLTAAFDKTYYLGITLNNGAEVVPRIQLTASPYSLSLIGQTNIFPSDGPVGAGTLAPASTAGLHVKKEGGTGRLQVEGSTVDTVVLKKGGNKATISYDGNLITISNLNLIINGSVDLPAGKSVEYNNLKDWRLVDVDDFSTGNDGWICTESFRNSTSRPFERFSPSTPSSKGYILRPTQHGWNTLKKEFDLTGIPHTRVKVVFTYHFFDTWDWWEYGFAGFGTRVNPFDNNNQQTGIFTVGWHNMRGYNGYAGTGYTAFWPAASGYEGYALDYNLRAEMVAQTSDDKFWVIFGSSLDSVSSDESYGISDIQIWVK
jgi:hypothetical protein